MNADMFYFTIDLFFLIISIWLIIILRFQNHDSSVNWANSRCWFVNYLNKISNDFYHACTVNSFRVAVLFLFCITVFTSVYKVGEVPYGLHVDEAGMAYDTLSLANYGVDRYLNPYPVYFINFGGGQSAMYTYLALFFVKIFGYSVICVRLPAIIIRALTFVAIYYTIGREYRENPVKTLLFLFLFAVCPYFIMQSRWGLDCNLLVGFLTLSVCALMAAVHQKSAEIFLLSGVSFGLTLYTYALSYIIIPVFLFLSLLYLLLVKKIKTSQVVMLLIPIILFSIPLIMMILVNKGIIPEYRGLFTIPVLHLFRSGEISLNNIFKNFYIIPSLLSFDNPNVFGRQLFYNAIPYFGTVFYFSIPFFVIGLVSSVKTCFRSIKESKFDINTIFVFWLFSVLACQFLILEPNINKANAVFIPILFFIVEGIAIVTKQTKAIAIGVVILYLFNFFIFFNYYFYQYNAASKNLIGFATDYIDTIRYSKYLNSEKIFILNDIAAAPYIYVLLENQVSPYYFRKNNIKTEYNGIHKIYKFLSDVEMKTESLNLFQVGKADSTFIVPNDTYWNQWFKCMDYKTMPYGNISIFYK